MSGGVHSVDLVADGPLYGTYTITASSDFALNWRRGFQGAGN